MSTAFRAESLLNSQFFSVEFLKMSSECFPVWEVFKELCLCRRIDYLQRDAFETCAVG